MSESQNTTIKTMFSTQDFCDRLKQARKAAGFDKQQSVADKLHVTVGTISKWEKGTSSPPLGSLVDLAALYNTTTDYLLTGVQTEHVDASRKYGLSNEALRMLDYLNHRLTVHGESLFTDFFLKETRHKSSEKKKIIVINPLAFINALLTSPLLPVIACNFVEHVFNNEYIPAVYESIEDQIPAHDASDVARHIWTLKHITDKIYAEYPHLRNFRFEKVNPKERLKMDEYHLNKEWGQLFRSLLRDISIIVNGIAETNSLPKPSEKLSDDEFDQLVWPYKNMEVKHEKDK